MVEVIGSVGRSLSPGRCVVCINFFSQMSTAGVKVSMPSSGSRAAGGLFSLLVIDVRERMELRMF